MMMKRQPRRAANYRRWWRPASAFMCSVGNRDFLLGKRFARDTGCTLIGDTHVLTVGERRLLLMHGDTLCDDKAHKRYRLGRSLLIPALAAFMPLARRRNLAAWMQEQSSSSRQPVKISKQTAIFSLRQNRCQL